MLSVAGLFLVSCPSCRGRFWCILRACFCVLLYGCAAFCPLSYPSLPYLVISSTLQAWRELGAHILTRTMYLVASPPPLPTPASAAFLVSPVQAGEVLVADGGGGRGHPAQQHHAPRAPPHRAVGQEISGSTSSCRIIPPPAACRVGRVARSFGRSVGRCGGACVRAGGGGAGSAVEWNR